MRVLFVVPSLVRMGAETQLVTAINGLVALGVEPHLLCFENNIDQRDRLDQRVCFHHVPRQSRFDVRPIGVIRRLIDTEDIQVVHCTLQIALFMGWVGRMLSRKRPPVVVAVHTTQNPGRREEFFDRYVFRWPLQRAARVIFVCETQRAVWLTKFPKIAGRACVVYNGIDVDTFDRRLFVGRRAEIIEEFRLPESSVFAISVAGFRKEKGHTVLLTAFADVLEDFPRLCLILAGDGPERDTVFRTINELGIGAHVVCVGSVKDVRPLLAVSTVSVIASLSETFSLAMLESLSMGVPMIGTDAGGTKEAIINGVTGRLVPVNDAKALANAIREVLADDELRTAMGAAGAQQIRDRYSVSNMVAGTLAVLVDACSA